MPELDEDYWKSCPGIFQLTAVVLSLVSLILLAITCDGTLCIILIIFLVVAFLLYLTVYILHILGITNEDAKSWKIAEFVISIIFAGIFIGLPIIFLFYKATYDYVLFLIAVILTICTGVIFLIHALVVVGKLCCGKK